MQPDTNPTFPHHRLDAYRVALELAVEVRAIVALFPRGYASLADQASRAAQSAVLLVAEGANRLGVGEKRSRFSLARGEVGECAAALEIALALGLVGAVRVAPAMERAARLAAMLTGLIRRFRG